MSASTLLLILLFVAVAALGAWDTERTRRRNRLLKTEVDDDGRE